MPWGFKAEREKDSEDLAMKIAGRNMEDS